MIRARVQLNTHIDVLQLFHKEPGTLASGSAVAVHPVRGQPDGGLGRHPGLRGNLNAPRLRCAPAAVPQPAHQSGRHVGCAAGWPIVRVLCTELQTSASCCSSTPFKCDHFRSALDMWLRRHSFAGNKRTCAPACLVSRQRCKLMLCSSHLSRGGRAEHDVAGAQRRGGGVRRVSQAVPGLLGADSLPVWPASRWLP